MHEQLTSRVLALAETLKPGEAVVFPDFIVCRSRAGALRFAGWNCLVASWWRGDFVALLAEHVEAMSEWRTQGYFASDFRRGVEAVLQRPRLCVIEGVGRHLVRFEPVSAA